MHCNFHRLAQHTLPAGQLREGGPALRAIPGDTREGVGSGASKCGPVAPQPGEVLRGSGESLGCDGLCFRQAGTRVRGGWCSLLERHPCTLAMSTLSSQLPSRRIGVFFPNLTTPAVSLLKFIPFGLCIAYVAGEVHGGTSTAGKGPQDPRREARARSRRHGQHSEQPGHHARKGESHTTTVP